MSDSAMATPDVSSSTGYDAMSADLDALDTTTDETASEGAEDAAADEPESTDERAPEETEGVEEEPESEPEPAATEEQPVEAKPEGEELPEGVRVVEKDGKREYRLKESRYKTVYDGYKNAQAAEEVFGEMLTPEVAKARQEAFVAQEAMISDFMSGDPRFIRQLAQWSRFAQENGEVSSNPLRQLATAIPGILNEIGDRETLDALAAPMVRESLDFLYNVALERKDDNLLAAIQHVDNARFGSYKKREQLAPVDPLTKREQELNAREAKLKERDRNEAQASFGKWQETTSAAIRSAVDQELSTVLEPIKAAYAKFPTDFQAVQDLLHKEFQQKLKGDEAWQARLKRDSNRAANASNPEVRNAVKSDLEAAFRAKAKWFFNPSSNPRVKQILSERASAMKDRSAANHQRQQTAAARREPGSVGTPVPQRVSEKSNGFGAEGWASAIDEALR